MNGNEHFNVTDWNDPLETAFFLLRNALREDRAMDDAATGALGEAGKKSVSCSVNAREELVLAGLPYAAVVYELIPGMVSVNMLVEEGCRVKPGTALATVDGTVSGVLRGERIFLNLLGRLCGIATATAAYLERCRGTGVEILDTRKTTPCFRALEKYAVRTAGGTNHRFSLADMAMLKDNHLAAAGGAGGVASAVERLRDAGVPIEIEVDDLDQLRQVLPMKPDRILLDNMTTDMLREAVAVSRGSGVYLEASGGITLETVAAVAATGVNGISTGAITHSVRCSDIGFDWSLSGGGS